MIPFTPNERRLQFTPSQNIGGSLDPDAVAVAQSTQQPTMMAQVDESVQATTDIDSDALAIANKSQLPLMSSLMGAARVNPDQAAEATKLGSQLGIGQDIALRNLEEMRQRAFMADIQRRDLAKVNPVLSKFLSNRSFANQASDDISSLSRLERIEEGLYDFVGSLSSISPTANAQERIAEFASGFRTGQLIVRRGKIGSAAQLRSEPTDLDWQWWDRYTAEMEAIAGDAGFWRQAGELIGQMPETAEDVLEAASTGAVYGGAVAAAGGQLGPQVLLPEEMLTVPAGMLIGAKAGAISALFTSSARTIAGNNYMENLRRGIDPTTARVTALTVGVAGGALEMYGVKFVAAPFRGLWNRLAVQAANDAVTRPTVAKAFSRFGADYLKATGGEIGTETGQQIVEIIGNEVAGLASDPMFQSRFSTAEGLRGIRAELTDVITRTAMGMAAIGAVGPTANFYIDTRRADRAKKSQVIISDVVEAINETKLKERNPDALEEYGDAALNEAPAYIRASVLRRVLLDNKIPDAEIDALMPGLSAKLREAEVADNFVSFPLAQFGVRLGGTPLGDAMIPHLTIDPKAMTPTELAAFEAQKQEFMLEAERLLEEKTAADEQFGLEAETVYAGMRQRLIDAGRDALSAEAEASIYQAMIVTAAAREGMTPQQYQEQYGLREVLGEGQAEQAQAFEQAVQPETLAMLTDEEVDQLADYAYEIGATQEDIDLIETESDRRFREEDDPSGEPDTTTGIGIEELLRDEAKRARQDGLSNAQLGEYIRNSAEFAIITQAAVQQGITDEQLGSEAYAALDAQEARVQAIKDRMSRRKQQRPLAQASRLDADYMAAVERGDMQTAQRMVDEAASQATWPIHFQEYGYHYTANEFTVFDNTAAREKNLQQLLQYYKDVDTALATNQPMPEVPPKTPGWTTEYGRSYAFPKNAHFFFLGKHPPDTLVQTIGRKRLRTHLFATRVLDLTKSLSGAEFSSIADWMKTTFEEPATGGHAAVTVRGNMVGGLRKARKEGVTPQQLFDFFAEHGFKDRGFMWHDMMRSLGYDAIMFDGNSSGTAMLEPRRGVGDGQTYTVVAVLDPNQIKLADPVTYDEAGNVVPLSRRFDITSPRIFEQAARPTRLMAVHNLSADNLAFAKQMGGLAVPSIGVVTEERGGVEGFGEITLIGTQEMADPATSRVFSSDAYSARFPRAEWPKVNRADTKRIIDEIRNIATEFDERYLIDQTYNLLAERPNAHGLVDAWRRSPAVMALFLRSKGVDARPVTYQPESLTGLSWDAIDRLNDLYDAVDWSQDWDSLNADPAYMDLTTAYAREWTSQLGDAVSPESLSRLSEFGPGTESRLRRDLANVKRLQVDREGSRQAFESALQPYAVEFKDWIDKKILDVFGAPFLRVNGKKSPYTLPNIVKYMSSARVINKEKGMTFGPGAARAATAKEFVDLEQMREAAKKSIVDPSAFAKATKKTEKLLDEYRSEIIRYTDMPTWDALDASMRAVARYANARSQTDATMRSVLRSEGFEAAIPDSAIALAKKASDALMAAPVPYFEAKPQRAVRIGEFAGAVIPSNATQETRDILDRNGVRYMTYLADNEQDRQRAVREMARSPEAAGQTLFQAARGQARGGFDPSRMRLFLTQKQDATTAAHEFIHFGLTSMTELARSGRASPQVLADLDLLFLWRKEAIAGDTPQERLATWLGMSIDQQRTALQEPLAYNGEIYFYEGKAPTQELQPVFDRLRAFILQVYKSIRDEINEIYRREFGEDLPMLTPEVRGVFDRMLASKTQIRQQEAINEMRPQFQTQEQSGMDDATWAAYQEMQAEVTEASITDLTQASLRQMQWLSNARGRVLREMQQKHDAARKEIATEVAATVRVEPVYRAITFLRYGKFRDEDGQEIPVDGPHKLDTATVDKMYELEPPALQPKLVRGKYGLLEDNGLNPDVVAEMFGYTSGDQMIRAIEEAKPIKDEIEARTDAEMLRRYSDLNKPAAQEAEIQKALHNEARARMVAVELRWAAKLKQPVEVLTKAAQAVAEQIISGKRVRDIRPSEYVAAESQAAREATGLVEMRDPSAAAQGASTRAYNEAVAAGKTVDEATQEAMAAGVAAADRARTKVAEFESRYPGMTREQLIVAAKRHQLLNNQLARAALGAREKVEKDVKYLRKVLRDANVKAMGANAADQIGQLLERFEVAPVSLKRLDERKSLAQFVADLEQQGLVPAIDPQLIAETRRMNYRDMTVAQFKELVEAIRQIEYIGKNARKVQLAAERAAYEETRDEIVARIRAVGRLRGLALDPRSPLTNIGRTVAALRGFMAQHLKAASVAYILDGGKEDGPLWNFLIRTANAAADKETAMRAEASAALAKIFAPVFALGNMGGKGMFFASINRSLNREARIAIALNMGNAGNMQRLLDGEGWTMGQLQPVLESLTETEWNAVQQVWDYINTYKPLIAAKERRLYGREPNWVEPQPLTVRTADGKTLTLAGGYYPVKYDPVASDRVATMDDVAEAKRALDGAYTAATTRRSFTKSRAEKVKDRPILYTLDAAFSGVNDVIHDLNWHEWLIQTQRLLRDPVFANAVRETRGPEFLQQLRDWTKDNAAGEGGVRVAGEAALSWLRRGISASGLGFNVVSAAMQITGFNQSIVKVGAKYVGRGIAQFAASPIETARMVADASSFMRERGRTQFREINEIKNRVRGQTEVARRVTSGTYFLMMNMQRTVDIPTWLGAYQKALDAGKDNATAVALADQAVRDTQGSGLISDLSAIERGGPLKKLFTVFYSYMNTVFNMTAMQTMTARSRGKLAADYVMLLVVPVVLGQAIKGLLQPNVDDDELDPEALARKLAAEELSYLMGTMVIVREFGGAAQLLTGAEGVRMGYGGPAGLRAVGEVYGLATQAGQMDFDRAFRRSAINTLGAFTGLPSAQLNRTIDGIEAVVEGEVEGVEAVAAPFTGVQR